MKLVYVSSGGTVYGRFEAPRASETTPVAPISGYGLAKVMIEEALRFTGRISGMPISILRVSNPVGLHQTSDAQGIVSIALRAARQGTAMKVFGDGSHVRDYVDADDVADAILAACFDRAHPAATWNVGSGTGRSILQVLALAEQVTGRRIRIEWHPPRAIDVPRIVLDCDRIRQDLGWQATRGLETAAMRINAALAKLPAAIGD